MHPTPSEAASEDTTIEPQSSGTRRKKRRWTMFHEPDEVNCVLRDYDAGLNAEQIREKHGVSKATLYRWISRYENQRSVDHDPGSMRLRIATLEKAVIHLSLENAALRAEREDRHPTQEAEHVAS